MKLSSSLPFAFAALSLLAPAARAADPFAGFRIPEHTWRSGIADASVSGDRNRSGLASQQLSTSSVSSRASLSWEQGLDSDPLFAWIRLDGEAGLGSSWHRASDGSLLGSQRQDGRGSDAHESGFAQGEMRAYPWALPVGLGLSGLVQGDAVQLRSRTDQRFELAATPGELDETRALRVDRYSTTSASVSAFAGLGRVRDASVIYAAHVLERRLIETGALRRPLSPAGLQHLAEVLFAGQRLGAVHDRPGRFLWDEIERALSEDGALAPRGLDAYSVLRGQEPTPRRSAFQRLRGWFAGPVLSAETGHMRTRVESEDSQRHRVDGALVSTGTLRDQDESVRWSDAYRAGGRAEFHRPLGWAWQLDGFAEATRPLREGERGFSIDSRVVAGWDIADRWGADGWFRQDRAAFVPRHSGGQLAIDDWTADYGVAVFYYLEDRVRISLDARETQARDALSRADRRYARFGVAISYRFVGTLEAPGVFAPIDDAR